MLIDPTSSWTSSSSCDFEKAYNYAIYCGIADKLVQEKQEEYTKAKFDPKELYNG